MDRPGHNTATFFVGTEIEHSPMLGRRTLFVVGTQEVAQILWQIGEADKRSREPITHVYFGANQSFPCLSANDSENWHQWENMIQSLLDRGYWCSLDLDVSCVAGLAETGLTESACFVPMVSVKLPYIKLLGYNAVIKLDDVDFNATNPGVWCHNLHDLMNRDHFTAWDQYRSDEIVR